MHSLKLSYLEGLQLPAQTLAGLRALHQFEGGRRPQSPRPSQLADRPTLPEKIHVHSSEPARQGYLEALQSIHEANPPLLFQVENLLALHEKVFRYLDQSGGQFKTQNNQLFNRTVEGTQTLVHTPFSASEIPQAMNQLIQHYHEAMESKISDPLVIIPLTLLDFIFIHPFWDGNGRMFRLLSVLLLYQAGFSSARTLHFDKVLQNSRGSGQAALKIAVQGWQQGKHDVKPWLHYCLGALSYAYTQQVNGTLSPL